MSSFGTFKIFSVFSFCLVSPRNWARCFQWDPLQAFFLNYFKPLFYWHKKSARGFLYLFQCPSLGFFSFLINCLNFNVFIPCFLSCCLSMATLQQWFPPGALLRCFHWALEYLFSSLCIYAIHLNGQRLSDRLRWSLRFSCRTAHLPIVRSCIRIWRGCRWRISCLVFIFLRVGGVLIMNLTYFLNLQTFMRSY